MGILVGKRVVLGVSGGIAAYKSAELCRRLVDAGAHVAPVMTEDAKRFIGEVTLSALASEPVHSSLWQDASPIPHTRLGQGADIIVVAPATARVLAAYAAGLSDDLLTATLIATRAPVVVCPAMHTEMWEHPAVQDNLTLLRSRGVVVVDPEPGRLAGGDVGTGRLAATEAIIGHLERVLSGGATDRSFAGLRVLVTAGGTREPVDAVRIVTNRSSGRQGHAIAAAAARRGATVSLVTTAASSAPTVHEVVAVDTAAQMLEAVEARSESADVVVMAAAVADWRPVGPAPGKMKKSDTEMLLRLEPTVDILAGLGARKKQGQTLVGFAAETADLLDNARAKMERKNLDLIVANDVSAPGVGFDHATNEVHILSALGETHVALTDKGAVAEAVLDSVARVRAGSAPPG
jgi:phosphopantothenoylcysteine decarboxylase/phosphopantothenate--cysteine ligase